MKERQLKENMNVYEIPFYLQAGLVILLSVLVPLLSAAPVPQSKEWTMGAGILFGAIAAGMFVKGVVNILPS